MFDAIYISALGLESQKEQLDAAAKNMSNASTPGYKAFHVDFSAVLDRSPTSLPAEALPSASSATRPRLRVDLTPGELHPTGRPLDIAIDGPGFIEVMAGAGATAYTRGGSLQVNADGMLTQSDGRTLAADIRVPQEASNLEINSDGTVTAMLPGDHAPTQLGQIDLIRFPNPEALDYQGGGLFTANQAAGEPLRGRPTESGAARLVSGSLEASNVRMVDEMVSLMLVQRVYELNAKVAQAADEMAGITNNLRHA